LCANEIGNGINSGVSLQANPNIIPWSPAPPVYAHGDVAGLFVDAGDHGAGVGVES